MMPRRHRWKRYARRRPTFEPRTISSIAAGIVLGLPGGAAVGRGLGFGLSSGVLAAIVAGLVIAVVIGLNSRECLGVALGASAGVALITSPGNVLLIVLGALGGAVAIGVLAYGVLVGYRIVRTWRATKGRRIAGPTARGLTMMAVLIGGRSRAWRSEEFIANLTRHDRARQRPTAWAQVRHGAGLVRAALVLRTGDLLDWVLAKPRTEWALAALTMLAGLYYFRTGGFSGLMANLQNVATVPMLIGPAAWGLRKHRGVPPVPRRSEPENKSDKAQR
jgi:hypothetical protein